MNDVLRPAHFQGLSEPLEVDLAAGSAARRVLLAVKSVTALRAHHLREEPFSLLLSGPHEPLLPQATYRVRHPVLGPVEMFLVPVARDASSVDYEAIFN
jgi:hypothetical protein